MCPCVDNSLVNVLASIFVRDFIKCRPSYRPSTKLRKGNVITGVCHSVPGVSMSPVMTTRCNQQVVGMSGGVSGDGVCPGGEYVHRGGVSIPEGRDEYVQGYPPPTWDLGYPPLLLTPPKTYGWQAGGTHPTGMLSSCSTFCYPSQLSLQL